MSAEVMGRLTGSSVLPDADACGVAFRVTLYRVRLHPVRTSQRDRITTTHDILKVVVAGDQVVLRCHLR